MDNNNQVFSFFEAIKAPTLSILIEELNKEELTKEDIVEIFYGAGEYVAVFYK